MLITQVEKDSVGEELGIRAGDELIGFDGRKIVDILDYNFYNDGESFVMRIGRNGEITDYDIEKYHDENLGLVLDGELETRVCRNKCIFCFVEQLPKRELRRTLRVKDDDYRLSFISGNYVTLTRESDEDLERIVRLKLSPLYISVHSSDNEIRKFMLGNKTAPDIMKQLKFLHDGGIKIHAQIVYCPGVNEDAAKTAVEIEPYCESLAVVPVGLTKDCNTSLKPVGKDDARKIVESVSPLQSRFLEKRGTRFVFLADEFYVKAEMPVPAYECYEDFSQLENGIGLIASFKHEFEQAIKDVSVGSVGRCTIATGYSAFSVIAEAAKRLTDKFGGEIAVRAVRNDFFGPTVTVAGLVTGQDIYAQLKDKDLGDRLILPRCMLREFQDVFLDDMTVKELSDKLKIKIKIINTDGYAFVKGCVEK